MIHHTTIENRTRRMFRGSGFRVALTVGGLMACLLACGIAFGLGQGGWVDYALFMLWAVGTVAGIYLGTRKWRSPIPGAVLGGTGGIVILIGYLNTGFALATVRLAIFTRSFVPFLHLPTENAEGYAAMLLMGIITSAIVGAAARLAAEGLTVRTERRGYERPAGDGGGSI